MSEFVRTRSNWIETYTGNQFWPIDPRSDEVRLEDIAHATAMQCRFTGHCRRFYSVAEHCVLASRLVDQEWAREALLHDAAEAYIHDMASPIKHSIAGYVEVEEAIEHAIIKRFGLRAKPWPKVKEVDMRLVVTERAQNWTKPRQYKWDPAFDNVIPYYSLDLPCWTPYASEQKFLERAKELGIK